MRIESHNRYSQQIKELLEAKQKEFSQLAELVNNNHNEIIER